MAEQITIEVPDLDDAGLTTEAKEQLTLFLENLKEQTNKAIADLEARVTKLE